MGVISIRFSKNEENILKYLTNYFDKDRSSVIKDSLIEKYEDLQDLKVIKKYESIEKKKKMSFLSAGDVLKHV